MRKLIVLIGITAVAALTVCAGASHAGHTCVFANDNLYGDQPNTVDGYLVTSTTATYVAPVLTGGLSEISYTPDIVMHPLKNIFYVADDGSSDIAVLKFDPATCSITLLENVPTMHGNSLGSGLAITPDGQWLYEIGVNKAKMQLLGIRKDGSLTPVHQTIDLPYSPWGVAISPDGSTLIVTTTGRQIASYSIDRSTGKVTSVSTLTVSVTPVGIAIDSRSHFVYVGDHIGELKGLDIETLELGAGSTLTSLGINKFHTYPDEYGSSYIVLSADGKYLYVSNTFTASITTLVVDSTTGNLTLGSVSQDGDPLTDYPAGLATNSTGKLVFSGASGGVVSTDLGILDAQADGSLISRGTFPLGQGESNPMPYYVVARLF
jgi:DNA-binding beta-propeller fold protein YncE